MTVALSEKMTALLADVKAGKADPDEGARRQQLGTLKRYGLVTLERGEKGEKWTVTDDGKAALKAPKPSEDEPEDS